MKRLLIASSLLALFIVVISGIVFFYTLDNRIEGEYFESNGVRIHYTEQGEGEPVLLIHGFAANIDMNWRGPRFLDTLAEHYRVIAIDNRGHGLSEKLYDPEEYGVQFVDDAVALLDHLGIERAHVVGYSMGGFITTKLITMRPERVVTASPCGAGWEPPEDADEKSGVLTELADSLEAGTGIVPLIEMLDPDGEPSPFRTWLINFTVTRVNDENALAAVARSLPDLQVTEDELRAVDLPVFQAVGEKDPLRGGVEKMAAVVPNHQLLIVPGADHVTTIPDPAFARGVLEFLQAHPIQDSDS
jgi:pimeloyl-ACP methyl ester carboxylesterase